MNFQANRIAILAACVSLCAALAACTSQNTLRKAEIEQFKQGAAGEYVSEAGAQLLIAPVRARMVADETIYVERIDPSGKLMGRLLALEISPDDTKVIQRSLVFAQEGQWRNLREQPEMFTALLPQDVKFSGNCDIRMAEDHNSVSYSCAGSPPETFKRKRGY